MGPQRVKIKKPTTSLTNCSTRESRPCTSPKQHGADDPVARGAPHPPYDGMSEREMAGRRAGPEVMRTGEGSWPRILLAAAPERGGPVPHPRNTVELTLLAMAPASVGELVALLVCHAQAQAGERCVPLPLAPHCLQQRES